MKFISGISTVLVLWLLVELDMIPAPPLGPLVLGVACAGFLLLGRGRESDTLHPVRVFGSLWCFLLAFASLRLLPVVSLWDYRTWALLFTGMAAFVGGFWMTGRFPRSPGRRARRTLCGRPADGGLPGRKTLVAATVCILIGTCVLAYEDFLIGTVPVLASNPDGARMVLFPVVGKSSLNTLTVKLTHPLIHLVKYGIFLAAIVLFQRGSRSRRKTLCCLALMLLGTLAYASQGARGQVVEVAVVLLTLHHYLRRRIGLRQIAVAGLVLFAFLGAYGAYRIQKSHSAPLFERALAVSEFPSGTFWAGPAFAYFTATSSFQVFNNLTLDLGTSKRPSHGFLFYGFHRVIPRANIQDFNAELYTGQMITPTFLGEFYADFGYWGVLLGPLILGLAYGRAYTRMRRKWRTYQIYVQALLLEMLIYFPYVNLFSQYMGWMLDLFLMFLLIRTLQRRASSLPSDAHKVHGDNYRGNAGSVRLQDRPAEG